jgi:polyhydroxyalkanoate synthesis repressor PhaR
MNQATRIIKKYPNRRLYDTHESRYITLNDVRKLIVDGRSVSVVENKTGRDITSSILMQVISELEDVGVPPLSEQFLTRVIRAHSHGLTRVVSDYLDAGLALATDGEPVTNGGDAEYAARLDTWRALQREIARRRAGGNGQQAEIPRPAPAGATERGLLKP